MLSAREYVEIMTCQRLNKRLPTDEIVDNLVFSETQRRLENLMVKMAKMADVPGFSSDDIEGFFLMKLHQEMRKGNAHINEFSYFARTFQNLLRNLNRDMATALKNLPSNPLDDSVPLLERDSFNND